MTPARSARRTPPGATARRFGFPRTSVGRLVLVVVVALVLDVTASAAVWVDRRDDPLTPAFHEAPLRGVTWTVDAYRDAPDVLGLSPLLPASVRRDAQGRIRTEDGLPADPDTVLRYVLGALGAYDDDGDRAWLTAADRAMRDLLDRSPDGLVPHDNTVTDVLGRTIDPPWYAASTQGLTLSALARMYTATGDRAWQRAAEPVFAKLYAFRGFFFKDQPAPQHWLTSVDGDGFLWFDRYSSGLSTVGVLREQLTTTLGLYDYRRALARTPVTRQAAATLVAGSVATVRHYLPRYRMASQISVSSLAAGNRNLRDHQVAEAQLALLGRITSSSALLRYARLYRADDDVPYWVRRPTDVRPGVDVYADLPVELGSLLDRPGPQAVDASGDPVDGIGVVDPTRNAAYAIAAVERYRRTAEDVWLRRAEAAVDAALRTSRDGFLQYRFAQDNVFGEPLARPWYSAEGQGLMLSALARLDQESGDPRWRAQATDVYRALTTVRDATYPSPRPWIGFLDFSGYLWFEQYADGGQFSLMLRGHVDALLGLYDYWDMTGDAGARDYFVGGVTSLRDAMPTYIRNPGGYASSSLARESRNPRDMPWLVRQVATLGEVTEDRLLSRYGRLLALDYRRALGNDRCAADIRCSNLFDE